MRHAAFDARCFMVDTFLAALSVSLRVYIYTSYLADHDRIPEVKYKLRAHHQVVAVSQSSCAHR